MPVCLIEGPTGLSPDSKKEMIQKVIESLFEAYQIPDDRVYVNEYPPTNVGFLVTFRICTPGGTVRAVEVSVYNHCTSGPSFGDKKENVS